VTVEDIEADELGYNVTSSIVIDVSPMAPRTFLEQASFFAQWSYSWGFGCAVEEQLQRVPCADEEEVETTSSPSASPLPTSESESAVAGPTSSSTAAFRKVVTLAVSLLIIFLNGGQRVRAAVLVATLAMFLSYSTGTSDESSSRRQDQEEICSVNVEVLYDSCSRTMQTTAPLVRIVSNVTFNNLTTCWSYHNLTDGSDPDRVPCTTYYNSTLTFPDLVQEFSNGEDEVNVTIPPETSDVCNRAIEGRPYVDEKGSSLRAEAIQGTCPAWSLDSGIESSKETILQEPSIIDSTTAASLWKDRALAEHASIASFASVTLALLTNGAPPELVSDTLSAALDEVRHAQVSFEVASLFASRAMEPGPLPSSVHRYEHNLTKLALSAAKEGCVDETLSALRMAADVDAAAASADAKTMYIVARLESIASDEGRHSVLAWRTVHWACQKDDLARQAVSDFFSSEANAPRHLRTLDPRVVSGWKRIYEQIVPLMATEDVRVSPGVDCSYQGLKATTWNKAMSYTEQLVDSIVHDVICALGRSTATDQVKDKRET
jgi:hypothetical protein